MKNIFYVLAVSSMLVFALTPMSAEARTKHKSNYQVDNVCYMSIFNWLVCPHDGQGVHGEGHEVPAPIHICHYKP